MKRGRDELKRGENKINRQATFAKRRNGLLKKAYELSVLCDAELALIIFSNKGKLYEFCSTSSMPKTLERYQSCSYGEPAAEAHVSAKEKALELSSQQEYFKLKARYDALQTSQRNLLGEDLGPLSSMELESLETQLNASLKQIRSTWEILTLPLSFDYIEEKGRGRVELKRIENEINRQVTFAKHRNGLFKKAYELSVLCDAELALIIFSNKGKLYEFCSTSSMPKILERYQSCSYGEPAAEAHASAKEKALELGSQQEYFKLKARYDALQRSQRNLLGEDLGPLSSKELESLQTQLNASLKQIRSTRAIERGGNLTTLANKTEKLRSQALSFKKQGTQLRKKMWYQNMKIKIVVFGILLFLILVIWLSI